MPQSLSESFLKKIQLLKFVPAKKIRALIEKNRFDEAFILTCKNCHSVKDDNFKLVELFLKSREEFAIDTNKKINKTLPLFEAINNKNWGLIYLLIRFGARSHFISEDPHYTQQYALLRTEKYQTIPEEFKASLARGKFEALMKLFETKSVLPRYTDLPPNTDNSKYDRNRLHFLQSVIAHLLNMDNEKSKFWGSRNKYRTEDLEFFESEYLHNVRKLVSVICNTFANMSDDFLARYNEVFNHNSLTWITLQQFERTLSQLNENMFFLVPIIVLENSQVDFKPEIENSCYRFTLEHAKRVEFIEFFLGNCIQDDLRHLLGLVLELNNIQDSEKTDKPSKISLPGIKAIVNHITDNYSLIQLMSLIYNGGAYILTPQELKHQPGNLVYNLREKPKNLLINDQLTISTKYRFHALLRKLQLIGELVTGRNLSRFIKDLDNTIHWQSFILVRDGITHQDEQDNKFKVDRIAQEFEALETRIQKELEEFCARLMNLIRLREQVLGCYTGDNRESYWNAILRANNTENAPVNQEAPKTSEVESEHRLPADAQDFLAVAKLYCPLADYNTFEQVFEGSITLNKRQKGSLLVHLNPKKNKCITKEQYDHLSGILNKYINGPKISVEDRQLKREQEIQKRTQRLQDEERRYRGLDEIRRLATLFNMHGSKEHFLNKYTRIDAAIEAIQNIQNILRECGYTLPSESSFNEWDVSNILEGRLALVTLLERASNVKDALEYNLGQAYQHLDKIKELPEARNNQYLKDNYKAIRALRNRLEHGDHSIDNMGHDIYQPRVAQSYKIASMAPALFKACKELLPELLEIKEGVHHSDKQEQQALARNLALGIFSEHPNTNELTPSNIGIASDYSNIPDI
ncbi:hypothetical protein [Legionella waltersii]|uniref:Uncharacterized protein n=1 Tax=Legionella waltersii TaxID=66969 RepID=A0A0W1ANQ4_9GAMM|nr:hypothetical protein [Legionella waltersii]KTD82948.1 hypothetical protein Lwal_0167 [Legionella waltersii]SNU97390.1 Uncharacterised protein [Legionella waltersii]